MKTPYELSQDFLAEKYPAATDWSMENIEPVDEVDGFMKFSITWQLKTAEGQIIQDTVLVQQNEEGNILIDI